MTEALTCPYNTNEVIKVCLKLGEKLGDVTLRPYQVPFSYRIIESLLKADGDTITGLFSRQCLSEETLLLVPGIGGRLLPRRLKNVAVGDSLLYLDKDSAMKVRTTKCTGRDVVTRNGYRVTLKNGQNLVGSFDHRVRVSSGKWKGLGELRPGDELWGTFRPIVDTWDSLAEDERLPYNQHLAMCLYFARIMLHKGGATNSSLRVSSANVATFESILGVKTYRNASGYFYPIAMSDEQVAEILSYGYANPKTVLKFLLWDSDLTDYRNNRKRVPKICIPNSNNYYSEYLSLFFEHYNLRIKEVGESYDIISFESLQRLQRYFESHHLYENLREFCTNYYLRVGMRFSSSGFEHVLRQYPAIKRWMPHSTLNTYRNDGIPCATLLRYLKVLGVSEEQVDLPQHCLIPVVDSVACGELVMVDIETESGTFLCGNVDNHNSGKTECVAVVCDSLMVILPYLANKYPDDNRFKKFKNGILIGIFAPSADQSKTTYDRMRGRLSSASGKSILAEYKLRFTVNKGDTVSLSNGSLTRSQTASKDSNVESKTYHLLILEEAQDIFPFKIKKSILPMITATNGSVVMIGTANTQINELYSNIKANKKYFNSHGVRNHFEYDWKEVCKHAPDYAKAVEKAKVRMGGEKSDEFRMSYCNEFIFERGMAFSEEQLSDRTPANPKGIIVPSLGIERFYRGRNIVSVGIERFYRGRNIVSVGIDVGKKRDSTVLTATEIFFDDPIIIHNYIMYRKRILGWKEMLGDNYDDQIETMVNFLRSYKARTCWVDVTGKGEPVYDMLSSMVDDVDMNPFTFGSKSKHLLYTSYLHDINGGRLDVPGDPYTKATLEYQRFLFQHQTLLKEYNGNYLVCKKPDSKIDDQEPHDDYPDSAALSCYAGKMEMLYVDEEMEENPFYGESAEQGYNSFLYG